MCKHRKSVSMVVFCDLTDSTDVNVGSSLVKWTFTVVVFQTSPTAWVAFGCSINLNSATETKTILVFCCSVFVYCVLL